MPYEDFDNLSNTEVQYSAITEINKVNVSKIARAWGLIDCAYVKKSNPDTQGEGFYLSCGKSEYNTCQRHSFRHHIHLILEESDIGKVILKDIPLDEEGEALSYVTNRHHPKTTTLQYMKSHCNVLEKAP